MPKRRTTEDFDLPTGKPRTRGRPLVFGDVVDYMVQAASRRQEDIAEYRPMEVRSASQAARGDGLIVDTEAQARISVLLASALEQMRRDYFPQEVIEEQDAAASLTKERAIVLVREHDGVRPAARALGIPHTRLLRALERIK